MSARSTDDLTSTGVAVSGLDQLLLDAKLSVPPPRRGDLTRAPLIEAARAGGRRVVGVTAPAGYGKSTLLAEWARTDDRPVAWASLDRLDDDPSALLTLLASAYARIFPGQADLVTAMGGVGAGTAALARAAPRLATALRTSPRPFVLVLDDLHELRLTACHDVLSLVVAGIPDGSQLVAASRREQPHLPSMRPSGDVLDLRAADLALDATSAVQIFSGARVHLTVEQADAVTEKTEGWPVGLHLAAVIAKDGGGPPTVSGDDRYLADYLYHEALAPQAEATKRFLRATAVLDQLCGPLCDALLGEPGGQEQLHQLEAANLFLIPLDRNRGWYRYHGLFREFLLAELQRVEPDAVEELHRRAAGWYLANGSPNLAVEHLLATTERDRCARLVTELALPTFQAGYLSTVQRWLAALGDEAIEAHPPLAVIAGWIAAFSGWTAEAQRWAALVETATFDLASHDGTASFDSARAMLRAALCATGPDQMLADATFAVDQEPPWSLWRDTALYLLGEARQLVGERDQAMALFAEASQVAESLGYTDTIILGEAQLALAAMDAGRWDQAEDHVRRAIEAVDRSQVRDYPTSVLAYAAAARMAWRRRDPAAVAAELARAMRSRGTCTFVLPHVAVRARLQVAKVLWATGEPNAARQLLGEIDEVLGKRPALGTLVDEVAEFRSTFAASARTIGATPLTPAELRVLPYLQTHLSFQEIAERLYLSRNTVKTQVGAIYRKLEVSARSDAVERATAMGLLGG